jgi:putative DNA primase/helicase
MEAPNQSQDNTKSAKERQKLLEHFYELVGEQAVLLPVPYADKGPRTPKWEQTTFADTCTLKYRAQLKIALRRGGNIGVLLGPVSGNLCAIDIDADDVVEVFLKPNPQLRNTLTTRGANGCQIWVQILGEYPSRKINSRLRIPGKKPGSMKSIAEWRGGGGHQSIIWGKHPDGMDYRFIVEVPVIQIAFGDINWPVEWGMKFDGEAAYSSPASDTTLPEQIEPELWNRILRYIEKVDIAVSGQGGSNPTFRLANVLVHGFALSREQAIALMHAYSIRCVPPWSAKEIEHKVDNALKAEHDKPRGYLRGESVLVEDAEIRSVNLEQTSKWSADPRPLHGELRPVMKMSDELLPEPVRRWVCDVAYRMQCPLDFVAVDAVCALSGVIGAGCSIRPKRLDNWTVVPNLWGGVISRPGMKKSPAMNEVFLPLRRLEAEAREAHEEGKNRHAAEMAAFEARKKAVKAEMDKAAKDGGERLAELTAFLAGLKSPEAPLRKRYITNNTTIEKASELMKENPRGLTMPQDELMGLLVQWDREDRKEDRCFHLSAWSGDTGHITDRIGRGTIDTPWLCESIVGNTQPSKLLSYLALTRNNIENDGLLQRFQLLVYPDEPAGEPTVVDELPDHKARSKAFAIFEILALMDFIAHGAQADEYTKTPYFNFDAEAQEFFYGWYLKLEERRRKEGESIMVEHLSKFDSLMPSLALIFHLVEIADWIRGQFGVHDSLFLKPSDHVSLANAKLAGQWCDYLETHARRIYGLGSDLSIPAAKKLLEKISAGQLTDGFSVRDVYRSGWSFLDSKELAQAAIDELLETGWLKEIPSPKPQPKGGRPTASTYRIHPKAWEASE